MDVVLHLPFGEIDGVQSSLQGVDVVSPQSFVKRHVDEGQQTVCIDAIQGAVPAHTEHLFTMNAKGEPNALCSFSEAESNHGFVAFRVTGRVTRVCDKYLPMYGVSVFKECSRS